MNVRKRERRGGGETRLKQSVTQSEREVPSFILVTVKDSKCRVKVVSCSNGLCVVWLRGCLLFLLGSLRALNLPNQTNG